MSWQIQIPYRSRFDALTDVAEAARELPTDEERAVVRQLVPARSWAARPQRPAS